MAVIVDPHLVERARGGELAALEAVLRCLQQPLYNLAVRMLGDRTDAQDATQEVLLKITTHLGGWRGDSAFGTWAFRIAANHFLNERARSPRRAEVSLDSLADQLDRGLDYARRTGFDERALTPEDKLEARRTALACTQAMLDCLDAPGRLAYVLDEIFGLGSSEAAEVQGISATAHRQRVARARRAVHGFMQARCGLANGNAACRCERQIPGKRAAAARGRPVPGAELEPQELEAADAALRELVTLSDAAAVMRKLPRYSAPDSMIRGIRLVVEQSWMLRQ